MLTSSEPEFAKHGFDITKVAFRIGFSFGQGGIAFGNKVLLNEEYSRYEQEDQLFMLAHESVHSAQWEKGYVYFAARYTWEEVRYNRREQYGVPRGLAGKTGPMDLRMGGYTLDRLADTIGHRVSPTSRIGEVR